MTLCMTNYCIQAHILKHTVIRPPLYNYCLNLHWHSPSLLPLQVTSTVSYQDVVVSCPTSSPPHLLAVLYRYISTTLPCSFSVHVHSSATGTVTDNLKRFFDGLPSSNQPKLKLTLIWKSGGVVYRVSYNVWGGGERNVLVKGRTTQGSSPGKSVPKCSR